MRSFLLLLLVCFFTSCGKSDKHTAKEITNLENEVTAKETKEIELSKDEEAVFLLLKEKTNFDYVTIGHELAYRLKRDIKNVDALMRAIELVKINSDQNSLENKIKLEIKKI